jgi:hypothetical protein
MPASGLRLPGCTAYHIGGQHHHVWLKFSVKSFKQDLKKDVFVVAQAHVDVTLESVKHVM